MSAFNPQRPDLTLGVIGTGTMGRGIAQVAAMAGIRVLLSDTRLEAATEAQQFVRDMLERAATKGRLTQTQAQAAAARLEVIGDNKQALAPCHVIIEAIMEDLAVKRALFTELEQIVSPTCILATNTSSLSVSAIAAACKAPERVAGFHFFNPVPLMKIVEIAGGVLTQTWVKEALLGIAERMGHYPALTTDSPGFLVNHAGRGFGTEALRIVDENIADYADVDRVMRDSAGFRMGPFELMDLVGLDVSQPVMESIYHQFYEEPRFRPSIITARLMAGGLLGRKRGRGFYRYENDTAQLPKEAPIPTGGGHALWISPEDRSAQQLLTQALLASGAVLDQGKHPEPDSVCIVTPYGRDTTTTALAQGLDPRRSVAVDTLFGLGKRHTLMTTPITEPALRASAHAALAQGGAAVTVIQDSPGFIAQRIVALIVNIGCDIAQRGIASPADIDKAVTLGLGYPRGPLALGDALGAARILAILEALHVYYGDPRYRPSPWLIRRAHLGISLTTPAH